MAKFNKTDGLVQWGVQFTDRISRISAHDTHAETSEMYFCGDLQPNEVNEPVTNSSVEFRAVMGKINLTSGVVSWLVEGTGSNPEYNGVSIANQDLCKGVAYDGST